MHTSSLKNQYLIPVFTTKYYLWIYNAHAKCKRLFFYSKTDFKRKDLRYINIPHKTNFPSWINQTKSETKIYYSVLIEQKGMTFDHDFGYSLSLLSTLLEKNKEEKEKEFFKNLDQKSCLSARSSVINLTFQLHIFFHFC